MRLQTRSTEFFQELFVTPSVQLCVAHRSFSLRSLSVSLGLEIRAHRSSKLPHNGVVGAKLQSVSSAKKKGLEAKGAPHLDRATSTGGHPGN